MTYPILNATSMEDVHPQFHNAYVDVKAHYAAVGDGVTDDTAAITSAVAALSSGGQLFFPTGTYVVSSTITVNTAGAHLLGTGPNTIIKATGTASYNVITLGASADDVTISDLAIYGSATTDATGQYGIMGANSPSRLVVRNVTFYGPDATTGLNDGIDLVGGTDCLIEGCYFSRLIGTGSNTGYGILITSSSTRNIVRGNRFVETGSTGRHAIYITVGSSFNVVADNVIYEYKVQPISIYATHAQATCVGNVIQGNIIEGGGDGTTESGAIGVLEDASENIISGNMIYDFNNDGITISGVATPADTTRNTVVGNHISGCGLRGIFILGAQQTAVLNNHVYNNSLASSGTHAGIAVTSSTSAGAGVAADNRFDGNIVYGSSHRAAFQVQGDASPATGTYIGPGNVFGAGGSFTVELAGTATANGIYTTEVGGFWQTREVSDPAAPATNNVRLYARDTGGKTELVARFPTGAVQQVAIEP